MKYIIMIALVIGMALSDIITGMIKAHVKDDYCSKVMRKGGLNKIAEVTVMVTACGLEVGISMLGKYYRAESFAAITGTVTAISVFVYIMVMEIISIFENFAEMNPEAPWARIFTKKLRAIEADFEEVDSNTAIAGHLEHAETIVTEEKENEEK